MTQKKAKIKTPTLFYKRLIWKSWPFGIKNDIKTLGERDGSYMEQGVVLATH